MSLDTSVLLASKDSVVGNKSPEDLAKLIAALQQDITILRTQTVELSQDNKELKVKLESQLQELKLLQKNAEER